MKLRLPHKFQAALLAALASVSFTTLSSGTLAVATGAALLAGQQAQANVTEKTTTGSITVGDKEYISTAPDGVVVVFGDRNDNTSFTLGDITAAEYTFLTSWNGSASNNGRYKVDSAAATRMANYGTIILANGTANGGTYDGGLIFVQNNVTIANDLILGTGGYTENNYDGTIRMSGGDIFTGDVLLAQDTKFTVAGSGNKFTGPVSGTGKTLTLQNNGAITFTGDVELGKLNITGTSTVSIIGSADNKSSIGNLTSVTGSTLTITNTNLGISGGQSFMSNLDIGAGSTVTVKQTDSMKYSGITNTITLREDGVLDFGSFRWTVGNGTTFVMAGGEIKGVGDSSGALDFHQNGATIRAAADSTISATIRLRTGGQTTNFDVNAGTTLTLSGIVKDSGNLHKLGAGALVLSGNASYSGSTLLDGGTLKVAQGGTLAEGVFTAAAGTAFVNAGTATVGKAGATSTLGSTVQNTGSLTLKGTINVLTADVSAYEVAMAGKVTYSGGEGYEGSGYLTEDLSQYYLVHSTGSGTLTNSATITGVASSEVQGGNLVFTRNVGATDTYYINSSFTYDETEMGGADHLVIAKDATLTTNSVSGVTDKVLHGSGSYAALNRNGSNKDWSSGNGYGLGVGVTLGADWTGTVVVSGSANNTEMLDLDKLGNNGLGTVEIKGLDGWTKNWNGTVAANIKLTNGSNGYAWKSTGSTSGSGTAVYTGAWSGDGTIQTAGNNLWWRYEGDVSAWAGTFHVNGGTPTLTFTKAATTVNATIEKGGGTLTLETKEADVTFNKAVTATYLTVRAGSTATFNADTTITDGITADGAGTVVVGDGRTLTLGRNAWTTGSDNFATNFVVGEGSTLIMEMTQTNVKTYTGDFTFKNGSTLNKYDGALKLTGKITLGENEGDVVKTHMQWDKNGFEFAGLVEGKGTVRLVGKGGNDRYLFSGANGGFTGEMMVGIKADGNVSDNVAYLDISGETALQHGIINLAGGNKAQLRLANSRVTIGGLRGTSGSAVNLASGTAAGILTISGNGTYEYAGSLASNVGLNLTGTGTQKFTAAGGVTLTSLTGTGGTLDVTNTLTVANADANEFYGTLAVGGLTKTGEGALTLHGISFIGNTIALQGGSLEFGAGEYNLSALQSQHTEEYSAENHGYLTITDKVQLVSTGTGVSAAEGAVFKYVSAEGTTTATTVEADGSVTLGYSSGNTYILNNNTSMDLAAELALKPALTVLVQGGTGTINLAEGTESTLQALEVESGSTATLSGSGKMALASFTGGGTLANNAYLQLGGDTASTFAGKLSGTGILEKVGSGTLTITGGNNGFTGDLIISDGSVKMGTTTSLGKWDNNRTIRVDAGGTLDYNGVEADETGYKVTLNGGTLANTGTGKDNNKRQVVTQLVLTDNSYINAASKMGIIGAGYAATSIDMGGFTLEKTGASTLYLTNTTISNGGTIKVSQGSVEFNVGAGASQLGSLGANLELAGGSVGGNKVKLANDITISATAAASAETATGLAVDMNGHTLTLDVADGKTLTLSGAFANGGTFVKTGTGTASLTGSATVSRTIQVNGGALNFNNATVTLSDSLVGFETTGGYIDWQGTSGQDGFAGSMDYIIFKTANGGTTNITSAVHGGETHELVDGKYHVDSEVDYTTYYIRTADAAPLDIAAALAAHSELATVDMAAAGTVAVNSAATLPTLHIQDGITGTVDGTAALTLNTLSLGNGSKLALAGTATVNASAISANANLDLGEGTTFNYTRENDQTLTGGQSLTTTGAGKFTYGHILQLQDGTMNLGSDSEIEEVDTRGSGTIELTGGTHEWTKLGMGQNQASNYTLNVQGGATLHITGTLSSDSNANRYVGSFLLSHWGGSNTVNVSGKLISEAVMSSWDGTPTVTVKSGGELELRQGLTRNYSVGGGETRDTANKKITLTVEEGGTLTVGATPGGDNFSHAGLAVTMQGGTTLGGYFGAANDVTVYQNITGPASGTLTIDADGAGHTLTLLGSLSGDASLVKTGSGAFMLSNEYALNHTIDLRGGSIGFSGTYDLSSIEHTAGEVTYHGGAVEGTNGFASANIELQLVTMASGTSIGDTANAHFIIDELTATLDADGYARTSGTPDYTIFHVLTGTENVSQGRLGGHDPIYSLADGAKLVVDGDVAVGKLTRETGSTGTASVEISGGNTLSVDGTNNRLSVSGSGVYELNGTTSLGGALEDSWTGTVRIVDASATNLDFAQYVKGISTLELKGFSGWSKNWYQAAGVNAENIKLTNGSNGYAWEFTGITGGETNFVSFTGDWSGDGKLLTKSNRLDYRFSGDISRWNGMFQVGNGNLELVFSDKATAVNAAIDRNNNTLNVEVGNGTDAFSATFGNTVNASKLEIKNGASATFNKAVTLSGDLTMDGTDAAQSHAVFKEGGSVNVIDLSHSGGAHGTVTVAAGKTLTYGSSFWAANSNRLILEEGATVAKAADAPATIKGLVGGGYVSSTANEDFALTKSCYTLSNVEATINTASDNVQLHFDNSKLATAQNITLKDTTSVFRGMDINGGTTTVGANNLAEDVTVQLGAVALSGGSLALANHVTGAVSGITVAGTGTISGGTLNTGAEGLITMGSAGALTLSGITVDLSAKELQGGSGTSYVEGQNEGNGFAQTVGKVQLVDFTAGGAVTLGEGASFIHGTNKGTLVLEDGADKGYVTFNDTSYNAFFVNVADKTESLLAAQGKAITEGEALTEVYLNAGTLDTTNADMLYGTLHVNSGEGIVYVTGDTASITSLDGKGMLSVGSGTNLNGTNLNIAAGDTLTLTGGATITYNNITNHGTLGIGENTSVSTGAFTISTGTFNTTGAGTLASSGKLTLSGGTVNLGSNAQFTDIDLGNGTLNISAGTTTVSGNLNVGTGDGARSGNITVADGATLTVNKLNTPWGFGTMTINGVFNATEQFSLNTGAQEYQITGTGTINTKELIIQNVTSNAIFSGGLKINVGDNGIKGERPLELRDVTIGVLDGSNGWTANRAIKLGDASTGTTFNVGSGKTVTLGGVLSGSGKMNVTGGGTLALNGANTFSGGLEVTGATVEMGHNNALGNANNAITIGQNGVIDLKGHDNVCYSYTLAGGTLQNTGADTNAGNMQTKGLTLTENSTIGGTGNFCLINQGWNATTVTLNNHTLTKTGTNTVQFVNTAITAGKIAVNEGTLDFRSDKTLSRVQADIELNGGTISGAYTYTASDEPVTRTLTAKQDATASAAIALGDNVTLSIGVDAEKALTMSGNITGNGAITKTGDGSLTLSGNGNVLYHAIDLQGGSLALNGAFDVTHIDHEQGGLEYYADPEGEATANGFAKYLGNVTLVTTTTPASVTVGQNASFTLDSYAATYDAATGKVSGKIDTSIFYVNDTTSPVNLEAVLAVNPNARVDAKVSSVTIVASDTEHVFSTDSIIIESGVTATTLQIDEDVTVAVGSANKALTITGSGTYALANASNDMKGASLGEGWSGIVMLTGYTQTASGYGTGTSTANSYIGLSGASGVDAKWNSGESGAQTVNFYLKDKDDGTVAWNWNNGAGAIANMAFSGKMAGSGTLKKTNANVSNNFTFTGDVSKWNGKLLVSELNSSGSYALFKGSATDIAVTVENESTQAYKLKIENDRNVTMSGDVKKSGTGAMNVEVNANTTFTGDMHDVSSFSVASGKTATLTGEKERSLGDVTVNGTLNIMDVTNAVSLSVGDVTIGANATVGVYSGETAAENAEGSLTINGHKLTAEGSGSTLNANLEMGGGSILDVSAMGGNGGLHMGSSVTLKPGEVSLSTSDMEMVMALDPNGRYDLFNGVDSFIVGEVEYTQIGMSDTWVKASEVFSNDFDEKDYYLFYSGAAQGGNGSNVGTIYVMQIPEPTTGTLSLLALAALAARRRRK